MEYFCTSCFTNLDFESEDPTISPCFFYTKCLQIRMSGVKKMEFYCSVILGWEPGVCYLGFFLVKMKSHMSPSCNTIKTTPKRLAFPISAALFFDWVIESPQDLWISSLLWGQSDGPNGCGSKLMSKEAWNTRCDQVTCCHFGSLIFIDFATFKQYRYNFSCFFPAGLPKAIPQVPIPNTMTINIFQVVSPVCIKLLKQSQQSCDS